MFLSTSAAANRNKCFCRAWIAELPCRAWIGTTIASPKRTPKLASSRATQAGPGRLSGWVDGRGQGTLVNGHGSGHLRSLFPRVLVLEGNWRNTYPDTPWDCHICRPIDPPNLNVGIYGSPISRVWDIEIAENEFVRARCRRTDVSKVAEPSELRRSSSSCFGQSV